MAEDRPLTVKERMAMFNKKPETPAPLVKAPSGRFPKNNNTTQNQTKAVDPIAKTSTNIIQEKKTIEKTVLDLRPTSSSAAPSSTSPRTTSSETSSAPGKLSLNKFNNFNGLNSNSNINAVKLGTPPPPVPPTRKSPVASANKSPTSNISKIFPPSNFPKTEQKSSTGTMQISNAAAATSPENKGTLNATTKSNISPTSTGAKQTYGSSVGISETGPPRQSVKKLSAGMGANINMNSLLGKSPPPRPASRANTPPFTPEDSGSSSRPVSTPMSPNHSGELQHLNMGRPKSYNRRLSMTPDKSILQLLAETKLLTMEEDIDNDSTPNK